MHDPQLRHRRVLTHLRTMCTTVEAKDSLEVFVKMMLERDERGVRGSAGGRDGAIDIGKVKKKWLEGLMGRKKT